MHSAVDVRVDPSRFPGRARAAYLESFRSRRMNHQFHYDTEKQAQLWLALHEKYSPARTDAACNQTYLRAFYELSQFLPAPPQALVSLGCGGGQKDLALLKAQAIRNYLPCDVSLPLALTAHLAAEAEGIPSRPVVLDLAASESLLKLFDPILPPEINRLFAFFGMMPNFEPAEALMPLAKALRPGDHLLVSANLAPGPDYRAGVERILPLYDNELTRRWLVSVVADAGLEVTPADLEFSITEGYGSPMLLRVEAGFRCKREQTMRLDGETCTYRLGEWFRLFFSYRHTPGLLEQALGNFGIEVIASWITGSAEEGVFLCRKTAT